MHDWPDIADRLRAAGLRVRPARAPRAIGGGAWSRTFRADGDDGALFLKTAGPDARAMLEAERDALGELAGTGTVRVPTPLACVCTDARAVLATEWLDLSPPDAAANRRFGAELAELHRHVRERHGWHRDNTIGATPQANAPDTDWVRFFRKRRLQPQFERAAAAGYGPDLDEDARWLDGHIKRLFEDYTPEPSLLHGDLWGGNWAVAGDCPVVFDPALYYGDRESDLAMTRLFGGFSPEFYRAYEAGWPRAPGFEARQDLYQLYHVLNHLNLFGAGYLGQVRRLIGSLRRAIG